MIVQTFESKCPHLCVGLYAVPTADGVRPLLAQELHLAARVVDERIEDAPYLRFHRREICIHILQFRF